MKNTLSVRQQRILQYVRDFMQENGRPPTVRNIQTALNISSTSVVDYNLKQLEERGELERDPNTSRGIRLLSPLPGRSNSMRDNSLTIPIMGAIAAGEPIEVPDLIPDPETWGDTVEVSLAMMDLKPEGLFALRVKGHSMVDALIADGDLVIMRSQSTANNGETVAVLIKRDRSTTLKRFYHEGRRVRLQPANVTMQPIFENPEDIEVQGKLVGVIRQLSR